ncbi:hypothetical protein BDW59DRAFT_159775 [Aspergillus cavernicola]|uniref:Mid2 domain-containing protein n=1 Tax=Aspergillus cavernicola TaxID=176166 RepID=A0ABR4IKT3_9EURO
MRSLAILLSIAQLLSTTEAVTCYRPNGVSSTHNDSKTCQSLNGAASMCCGESDTCLENGICKVSAVSGVQGSNATYWRDTCSVSTWPEVGCLKVCASGDLEGDNSRITPCDGTDTSETWCCGTDTSCCGTDDEIHVPSDIYTSSTSTPTSTSTSTSTSTTQTSADSSTSTPTSAPESESEQSDTLSDSAKAGVGVGVAVGAVAIVASVVFFLLRRRKTKAAAGAAMSSAYSPTTQPLASSSGGLHELDQAQVPTYEKPAGVQDSRYELPGDRY